MLEYRRKGRHQVVDQLTNVGNELARSALRQLYHARLAWLVKVVYVEPVRGRIQSFAFSLEVATYEREPPGPRLTHYINVIARARHRHAELQRLDSPLLSEHAEKGLQLIGGLEGELAGFEGTGERIRRQAQAGSDSFGHWKSLQEWPFGHD